MCFTHKKGATTVAPFFIAEVMRLFLACNRNAFHVFHVATQFLTNRLDRVVTDRVINVAQLCIIYAGSRHRLADVARLQ